MSERNRRVVLAVTGGIAAYKAADLCSFLVQRGDRVDVILTEGAEHFVGAATFAALSRRPVATSLWDAPERIAHIALARDADVLAVVPATANAIARLALGLADDLLTNVALATRAPLVVAPAMNSVMYEHPATRGHLAVLVDRGVAIVPPESGFLAEREVGIGRLATRDAIAAAIDRALTPPSLAGERVLITAGPTREPLDAVRFLSNPATGTIGIALAAEAVRRGARVDLILGPTLVPPAASVNVVRVTTADEMAAATFAHATDADIVIATAAVSDFRPAAPVAGKVKKSDAPREVRFEPTVDILATLGARRRPGTFLVGFAAETHDVETYAREKLAAKHLDAIVANDVSRSDAGFGTGEGAFVVLWQGEGRRDFGRGPKAALARTLWDTFIELRAARTPLSE